MAASQPSGPPPQHSPVRRRISRVLVGLASVTLLLSVVLVWAADTLFDSSEFADRAVAALGDDDVAGSVAAELTDQLVDSGPEELLSAKPVIEAVTLGVLQSERFQDLARAAAADLHRALFSAERESVTLDLADVVTTVLFRLDEADPEVGRLIPDDVRAGALRISDRSFATDAVRLAERVRALAAVFPALTVLLWVGAIVVAQDRRDTVSSIGFSAVGVALLTLLLLAAGHRLLAVSADTAPAEDVIGVVWHGFTQPLRSAALVVGFAGAVSATLAVALVRPVTLSDSLSAAGAWLGRRPETQPGRWARAIALAVVGLLVVLQWQLVVQLATWSLGFFLVFAGMNEIIRLAGVGQVPDRTSEELRAGQLSRSKERTRQLVRGFALVGVILVFGVLGFALWRSLTGGPPSVAAAEGCNGHEELCDVPLDRVALAATHNSMAASGYPGWLFAEHVGTIEEQLEDGVRGLLIDTWYGADNDQGGVVTDFGGGKTRDELVALYGESVVEAAERVSEDVGTDLVTSEVYLCHNFCELGAVPFVETLAGVRSFLDANPGEVLVIVIQDQTAPEDVAAAFEESGLIDLVWDGFDKDALTEDAGSAAFPTLGEMVERNERVLVMAENDSGEVPWYYDAFTLSQDTPFRFDTIDELEDPMSCERNRGRPESPMLLLNHWLSTDPPNPSVTADANDYDVLFDRAIRCGRARDLVPNLIAVDFYSEGDLFAVVDTLNGVRSEADGDPTSDSG